MGAQAAMEATVVAAAVKVVVAALVVPAAPAAVALRAGCTWQEAWSRSDSISGAITRPWTAQQAPVGATAVAAWPQGAVQAGQAAAAAAARSAVPALREWLATSWVLRLRLNV